MNGKTSYIHCLLNGTPTATGWGDASEPEKIAGFKYNSAGLRVQKDVTINGVKSTTKYTLHGICVSRTMRGQCVGKQLIRKAIEWAKAAGLDGLALETQDNNVLACRFYAKCGFSIGGVNTMFYQNFSKPYSDETAIFWYMKF